LSKKSSDPTLVNAPGLNNHEYSQEFHQEPNPQSKQTEKDMKIHWYPRKCKFKQ
jgi:hypothetical protein